MGWRGEKELQRGAAAVVRCRVEEKRHCSWKKRGNVTRFVVALAHRRENEEWRKGGPRLGSGLRRRGGGRQAPEGTVAHREGDSGEELRRRPGLGRHVGEGSRTLTAVRQGETGPGEVFYRRRQR
jgi:hypothetical protein